MTPTNKGLYKECNNCIYQIEKEKYPCYFSHKKVREASGFERERDFINCGLYKGKENE